MDDILLSSEIDGDWPTLKHSHHHARLLLWLSFSKSLCIRVQMGWHLQEDSSSSHGIFALLAQQCLGELNSLMDRFSLRLSGLSISCFFYDVRVSLSYNELLCLIKKIKMWLCISSFLLIAQQVCWIWILHIFPSWCACCLSEAHGNKRKKCGRLETVFRLYSNTNSGIIFISFFSLKIWLFLITKLLLFPPRDANL